MANIVDETNREVWNEMKSMPDKLLRLLKAILQIHEYYEKEKNTKLKDNFEDLKKQYAKLNEVEKELHQKYNAIYNEAMEKGNFEALLPKTYNEIKKWVIEDIIGGDSTITARNLYFMKEATLKELEEGKAFNDLSERIDGFSWNKEQLENVFFEDYSFSDLYTFWTGYERNEDFRYLLEKYSEEYEDLKIKDYIDKSGNLDYFRFGEETEIYEDIFKPIFKELLNDPDITKRMEEVNNEWRNEVKEAQQKSNDLDTFINSFSSDVKASESVEHNRNDDLEL